MSKTRVVITGAGVISSLAHSRQELLAALLNGACGVRAMPEWAAILPADIVAAPVTLDQDAVMQIDRRFRRSMGPAALFATLAATQAVKESGLSEDILGSGRAGCPSATMGSASSIMESCSPCFKVNRIISLPRSRVWRYRCFQCRQCHGLRGVLLSPCSACASSLQAMAPPMNKSNRPPGTSCWPAAATK